MPEPRLLKVLFICSRNAARSQIAEAILHRKGRARFIAASAGAEPATEMHPMARQVLADRGIEWKGRPKGFDQVIHERWDLIITLCDRAKEVCPTFEGQPVYAHWGIDDPSEATGNESARLRAFDTAASAISARIDLMLALPQASLEQIALEQLG